MPTYPYYRAPESDILGTHLSFGLETRASLAGLALPQLEARLRGLQDSQNFLLYCYYLCKNTHML